ncbi:TetR family transcriptional regulator [Planobispora rosea]|uniref:TetR family transcriptional regulator n=1 Tax=Planobispora rosea TaxID=35762 RepID=A0A8J3WCR3_PLARO|nr:TetR/AcrR family transcriptional regulator [Planobispora rosea]GGS63551.1 TetR family transcriptional regulator [Planobispora rosea]GIH84485.1 TetR family transcriptional regulator [Planobispora rosea]
MRKTGAPPVRERLLDTADALFYAEGIRAVGIDRVIAESKVSKSTMYVHFRTKEELVEAYLRRRTDRWRAHVHAEVDRRADDPRGRVLAVFDVFDEQLSAPGYRGCPFVNAAAEYPHHEGIQNVIAYHRRWLTDLFPHVGAVDREEPLAAALLQLLDGAVVAAHLDRDRQAARRARRSAGLLLAAR